MEYTKFIFTIFFMYFCVFGNRCVWHHFHTVFISFNFSTKMTFQILKQDFFFRNYIFLHNFQNMFLAFTMFNSKSRIWIIQSTRLGNKNQPAKEKQISTLKSSQNIETFLKRSSRPEKAEKISIVSKNIFFEKNPKISTKRPKLMS